MINLPININEALKRCGLIVALLIMGYSALAQMVYAISQTPSAYSLSESDYMKGRQESTFMGLHADPQLNYKFSSPWLTNWAVVGGGQSYWLSSTTTQSFNHGKFGTIYYYDQMGNMRYASPFVDIAGKNKRGLKLLLPTFTQRMFTGR